MISRAGKLSYLIGAVFALFVVFVGFYNFDSQTIFGATRQFSVSGTSTKQSTAALVRELSDLQQREGGSSAIAREVPDLVEPLGKRRLYVAGAMWNPGQQDYPYFSRDMKTAVAPLDLLRNIEPQGVYFIKGSSEFSDAAADVFTRSGLNVENRPNFDPTWVLGLAGGPRFPQCLALELILVLLLSGAGAALSFKRYSVERLLGNRLTQAVLIDLREIFRISLILGFSVLTVSFGGLLIYNHAHHFGSFCLAFFYLYLVQILAAFVGHCCGVALISAGSIASGLGGKVGGRRFIALSYGVRIVAIILLASLLPGVMADYKKYDSATDALNTWRTQGSGLLAVQLNGRLSENAMEKAASPIGAWIRNEDKKGHIVLGEYKSASEFFSKEIGYAGPVMILNAAAADREPSIRGLYRRDIVSVIVPSSIKGLTPGILKQVAEWCDFERSFTSIRSRPPIISMSHDTPFQVFGYSGALTTGATSKLVNPVIVIVPDGSRWLSLDHYFSAASRQQLYFTESARPSSSPVLSPYLIAAYPASQDSAVYARLAGQSIIMDIVGIVIALGVSFVGSAVSGSIWVRLRRQRIFVDFLMGRSFSRRHSYLILLEALFVAISVAIYLKIGGAYDADSMRVMGVDIISPHLRAAMMTSLLIGFTITFMVAILSVMLTERVMIKNVAADVG